MGGFVGLCVDLFGQLTIGRVLVIIFLVTDQPVLCIITRNVDLVPIHKPGNYLAAPPQLRHRIQLTLVQEPKLINLIFSLYALP